MFAVSLKHKKFEVCINYILHLRNMMIVNFYTGLHQTYSIMHRKIFHFISYLVCFENMLEGLSAYFWFYTEAFLLEVISNDMLYWGLNEHLIWSNTRQICYYLYPFSILTNQGFISIGITKSLSFKC